MGKFDKIEWLSKILYNKDNRNQSTPRSVVKNKPKKKKKKIFSQKFFPIIITKQARSAQFG